MKRVDFALAVALHVAVAAASFGMFVMSSELAQRLEAFLAHNRLPPDLATETTFWFSHHGVLVVAAMFVGFNAFPLALASRRSGPWNEVAKAAALVEFVAAGFIFAVALYAFAGTFR